MNNKVDHCYYEFTCDICNGDYQADRKFGDICPQCLTKNKGLSILVSEIKALSKDIKMLKEEKNKLKEHITQVEALLNNLCELLSLKRY